MLSEKSNLTEQTVERLQEMLAASGLEYGQLFATEAELEQRLSVSRSIIREAVSRMRAMGLLDSRQGIGLIVSKPDPIGLFEQALNGGLLDGLDLQQLGELRYALEIGSIELVVRHATSQQLAKLAQLAEEFADNMAGKPSRELDNIELDFHQTILDATASPMLMRMHGVLAAYFSRSAREVNGWGDLKNNEKNLWEHRAIALALAQKNSEHARAILANHLAKLLLRQNNNLNNKENENGSQSTNQNS
jgi:GntR family transcriptional regulator, transcriptional repressor for pyruvate dehydrogenase complex